MPANAYLTPLEGRERVRQSRESCQDVWDLDVKCISCAKKVVRKKWVIGVIRLIRAGQVTGVREWPVQSANESAKSRRTEQRAKGESD